MAKAGGGAGRGGGGGGLGTRRGKEAFGSAVRGAVSQISQRQRGFRSSQRAYQRLERARDILTGGRADVLYGDPTSSRVARAQQLLASIKGRGLDTSVTFGKFW